jgi:hypothetical protein
MKLALAALVLLTAAGCAGLPPDRAARAERLAATRPAMGGDTMAAAFNAAGEVGKYSN